MRVKVKAGQSSEVLSDQAERRLIKKFCDLSNAIESHCDSMPLNGLAHGAHEAANKLNNYLESLEPKCPTTETKPVTAASAAPSASHSPAAS